MFASGFDLESACAVMVSDDDFATLDLLDALVRKSLLVADRSSAWTRFSMLETTASSPRNNWSPVASIRHSGRHLAVLRRARADILALWDSPRQSAAYGWFAVELANLRTAFGGPPTTPIWMCRHPRQLCGVARFMVQTYEPIAGLKS